MTIMRPKSIDDILPLIERPSRYLGTEVNAVKKDLKRVKLKIALAFPDLYEIGMSHFGLQILYHVLNASPDIAAERVFAPAADMEAALRAAGLSLCSLESSLPLSRFDIVGFSLLYELNYSNILTMLDLASIPFLAARRGNAHPLVIAGGPCSCNPEPVADFFDAIVIGDGEEVVRHMASSWLAWKGSGGENRQELLKAWSGIEGVYIPSFFEPGYDASGFQRLQPKYPDYTKVKRTIVKDLDQVSFPDAPILPYGRPVHDRLRLEVARGCTRGCRFCQAGMIYRPVRERAPELLLKLAESSLKSTGYEDLSLLSLSTGDYDCIAPLMEHLMGYCEKRYVAVSLPSIRAGTLTPQLMDLIRRVRKTGFTIAPEAGSQRLRDVINKNITTREIEETVENAFGLGWRVIKLYFMIGLPTETQDDLAALVDLVMRLRRIGRSIAARGKARGQVNVSIATFIPKPHTPFQWAPQLPLAESKKRINWLKERLSVPGIHFKWQNPEVSFLEGVWSRGDRRLSRLLMAAYRAGCRFDGWSDSFQPDKWRRALEETAVDADFFTTRDRRMEEPLPWDHIDTRVDKSFLVQELQKSLVGEHLPDCRSGVCHACGVCDFEKIAPVIADSCPPPQAGADKSGAEPGYKSYALSYYKKDRARFFGHLELANIFLRALKRAGIPLKYSKGFHPLPKVSFADPLPVGIESENERLYISAEDTLKPHVVVRKLNRRLPAGLKVLACQPVPAAFKGRRPAAADYRITLKDGNFDQKAITYFENCPEMVVSRRSKKGNVKYVNLKETVLTLDLQQPNQLRITLDRQAGNALRPGEVLRKIFTLPETTIKQARIIKTAEVFPQPDTGRID